MLWKTSKMKSVRLKVYELNSDMYVGITSLMYVGITSLVLGSNH